MARAHRHFIPHHVWHITHRCHQQAFLLKFAQDRRRWRYWLFEAKKRFGLCVLNYMVTSNHIHLLVRDTGNGAIPRSLQLIAGRTAQEYNRRKGRKGAYWEDRYHATAVETNNHLAQCLVYIDLNMVRAGVVAHPAQWPDSGCHEIQRPPKRYRIIDRETLLELFDLRDHDQLRHVHQEWVTEALNSERRQREACWSESVAVGSQKYVETVKSALGIRARTKQIANHETLFMLREPDTSYHFTAEKGVLSGENRVFWDVL